MKTAVVYYSMCGNTAYVASEIQKQLDAELIELVPVKAFPDKGFKKFFWGGKSAVMAQKPKLNPYVFNADEYDRIIIGFPVWASRIAPPLRTFVTDNGEALAGKSIAAFACQAGSGAEKALDALKALLGIEKYSATMILIDPKEKPDTKNVAIIEEFCSKVKEK